MDNPKVSIIIPVYNGSNYLANAIDCALGQTYDNIEVIVVNDGSTDGGRTEEIALSYGAKIRYFYKANGGVSTALNFGIDQMTGQYFSWLSHDDAYSPNKVSDAVELLRVHNAIGKRVVAFTGGYHIDVHGDNIGNFPAFFVEQQFYSGIEVIKVMTKKGTLNGCCMLIPRDAFEEAGIFHESLRYSQDALMWYRIFLAGFGLVADNRPNVMNRLHAGQVSHLRRDLFSRDALVIAKLLAEPLSMADPSGLLLLKYTKRLCKYECTEAVKYLLGYGEAHGIMNRKDRIGIQFLRIFGYLRYRAVGLLKKMLITTRR